MTATPHAPRHRRPRPCDGLRRRRGGARRAHAGLRARPARSRGLGAPALRRFLDIAWDDPDHAIRLDDPRWVLPSVDVLGGTDWYRSLRWRSRSASASTARPTSARFGLQFEQISSAA